MPIEEAKAQYNYLKDTGDLYELVPYMTGEWNKDKKLFLEYYKENEDLLNGY